LPAISEILRADGVAFVLIKPQFECEKKNIGKSGIVHPSAHPNIVKKIIETCLELGLYPYGIVNAPVRKGKNIEYVLYLKKTSGGVSADYIVEKVKNLVKSNTLGELV
jgi:predicted rRNA methylase YqxC with S4 and FtsJ domains